MTSTKNFRSLEKANAFAEELAGKGFEYVAVSGWVGAFGYHEYRVEWR